MLWYINRPIEKEFVQIHSLWITGATRSGKTQRLVAEFTRWVKEKKSQRERLETDFVPAAKTPTLTPAILVFAANNDQRRGLADLLATAVKGSYPVVSKTPLGFITDEVKLFWPILFEQLDLKAQFPLQLRPETEQDLATRLWHPRFEEDDLGLSGRNEYRFVRRILDLLQLAGASGIPPEDIPVMLAEGLPENNPSNLLVNGWSREGELWEYVGELLLQWRDWCWERGLLSYGIIYELYWRYLFPSPPYQEQLIRRYQAIFADDVDDYPAIAGDIFTFLLARGAKGVFTYNPYGKVRLGLNADPNYLEELASLCQVEELSPPASIFTEEVVEQVVELVTEPTYLKPLLNSIQAIQTTSRASLLRETARIIIKAVSKGEVKPHDIAIIAPGLDEIARYTLIEILTAAGIPVRPLNEQRPLISSPLVRALLTLLTFVYPDLGRLVDRDSVAEMLVVLSQSEAGKEPGIDPVRAGLFADNCYLADLQQPKFLPVETYPRWDRLGAKATQAYNTIRHWIGETSTQEQQQSFPRVISVLDRAIKKFLGNSTQLTYTQLAALRELMETAQHYWEVERRLRENEAMATGSINTVAQFILLLRRGTITANPRPVYPFDTDSPGAVILATVFQYRSLRSFHSWQFWLDVGSTLWSQGGAANLFAYPLFLQEWPGKPWLPEDEFKADTERLQRILNDLLGRVGEKVYLCHSDLAVNGTEQTGALLSLVYACETFDK